MAGMVSESSNPRLKVNDAGSASVLAVDNSTIELDVGDAYADRCDPWTGYAMFTPRRSGLQTTAELWGLDFAPLSALAAGVESVGGRERERFQAGGGQIRVFDCDQVADARWAAWLGPWHMVHGMFHTPQWESGDIAESLLRVRWTDTPDGLVADVGQRFNIQRAVYITDVAGVGTLRVERKSRERHRVPAWRGYQAPAGEIWRVAKPEVGAEELMLATPTVVASLDPWNAPDRGGRAAKRRERGTVEDGAAFLASVQRLSWRA